MFWGGAVWQGGGVLREERQLQNISQTFFFDQRTNQASERNFLQNEFLFAEVVVIAPLKRSKSESWLVPHSTCLNSTAIEVKVSVKLHNTTGSFKGSGSFKGRGGGRLHRPQKIEMPPLNFTV